MRVPTALLALTVVLVGCESDLTPPDVPVVPEARFAAVAGGGASPTYFTIRRDYRRCIRPLCGGVFLAPLNETVMRCADGHRAAECYAAQVEWAPAGLSDDEGGLFITTEGWPVVQGQYSSQEIDGYPDLGYFVAEVAWAPTDDGGPGGLTYRVSPADRVCRGGPCPPFDAYLLNSHRQRKVSAVDLDAVFDPNGEVLDALLQGRLLLVGSLSRGGQEGVTFTGTRALLPY